MNMLGITGQRNRLASVFESPGCSFFCLGQMPEQMLWWLWMQVALPLSAFERFAHPTDDDGPWEIPDDLQAAALHIDYQPDYDPEVDDPPPFHLATPHRSGFAPFLTWLEFIVDHPDGLHPRDLLDVTGQDLPRLEVLDIFVFAIKGELPCSTMQ